MICPNCRCVVPESMNYCGYCGYDFTCGTSKTLRVEDCYSDGYYRRSDYGEYSQRITHGGKTSRNVYYETMYVKDSDSGFTDALLAVLAGVCCALLLVMLAVLVFLI